MTNEIRYNGHSAQPSDYGVQDGDLSTCVGVVPEDGSLRPVMPPAVVLELHERETVLCLHVTNSFTHYIVLWQGDGEYALRWIDEDGTRGGDDLLYGNVTVYNVATIGNTLVVLTDKGMWYFLWKADDGDYLSLGEHLPELPLSFGLRGTAVRMGEDGDDDDRFFKVDFPDYMGKSEITSYEKLSDDNADAVTSAVLAKVNKFIADEATNKGRFMMPFLVRYAYRLYDETLTMHSAPILMVCTTGCAPEVIVQKYKWEHNSGDNNYEGFYFSVAGVAFDLDYAADSDALEELRNWSDIVKSVDVFISAPIYTYDQSGKIEYLLEEYNSDLDQGGDPTMNKHSIFSYCRFMNPNEDERSYGYADNYMKRWYRRLLMDSDLENALQELDWDDNFDENDERDEYGARGRVRLPRKDAATVIESVRDTSTFYLLKSIDLDDLQTERTEIEVPDDYLQSLVNREAMTDDLYSHDTLIPKYAFNYNSRLNVADLRKTLFGGYYPNSQFMFNEGWYLTTNNEMNVTLGSEDARLYVYIKYDGRTIVVSSPVSRIGVGQPFFYVFYPNANAYRAVLQTVDTEDDGFPVTYYELKLRSHDFLNGAYWFDGWDGLTDEMKADGPPEVTDDPTVEIENYIYTSEANDPFNFSIINAVGTGRIIALSSAAKALSQGQFGQFPLYAFATDGVWALTVNDDGSYSAKQPITRDVALSAESVTQLDSAVLFATDRGIMLITGSQTDCISDMINAPEIFSPADLPNAGLVMEVYNRDCKSYETLELSDVTHKPFLDFVAECRMIYDYVHQRIIVYNTSEDDPVRYAYVFSLRSRSWGMIQTRAYRTVASYPKAYAMTYAEDGETPLLVDFSAKSPATEVTALIVTRPITIGAPNDFKTISTVIQRGRFPRDAVRQVLYGSNDLYAWFPVWSSVDRYLRGFSGTPYKHFRLAMVATLKEAESLYGCTVEYRGRMGNRPR